MKWLIKLSNVYVVMKRIRRWLGGAQKFSYNILSASQFLNFQAPNFAWLEVKRTFDETEQMERLAIYCQGYAD